MTTLSQLSPMLILGGSVAIPFGQLLSLLLSAGLVVVAAIWVTKLVAGQRLGMRSANLQVVESLGLGGQTAISIIKVGEQHILVGITKEGINYLCDIDAQSLTEVSTANQGLLGSQFSGVLAKYLKKDDTHDQTKP